MNTLLESGLIWWITAFDLPAMSGLLFMIWKARQDSERSIKILHDQLEVRCSQLREALSAFKLEVAKNYASVSDLKDLEGRIVTHLLRIETKLDQTALKAEALRSKQD